MKKRIRLTESDLHKLIKKCIRKTLTEGYSNQDDYQKWQTIKETIGADKMVDDILQYLDSRIVEELIEDFNQDYDLFENEYEDEEDDDDDVIL
jgi:hypothetical protein